MSCAVVTWCIFVYADGSVTPGPLPQPVYLNVPLWLVAVVGCVVVAVIVTLKAADYRCSIVSLAVSGTTFRRCVVSRRMRASGDHPTSFLSLAAMFQALVRLVFSIVITTRMYYVDSAKWTYLWVHMGAVCVGVCMSVAVVVTFFRRVSRSSGYESGAGGSSEASSVAMWTSRHAMTLRIVKLVSIIKPGVVFVLQSGVSSAFDIPVAAWHPGWR